MLNILNRHKIKIILWTLILLYIGYFSYFTILRYKTLYSSYFDLGIMHQTVYNTYQAIKRHDMSRFLELTNPFGPEQIKRMAIHNDILLAFMAPFYFIYSGPETLLVIQTVVLALGAWAVFLIAKQVFEKEKKRNLMGLIFVTAYLLYPPMQRANIFEFHAVTLATTTLLFMFYFWLIKKYKWSFLFFILSIIAKEQVALTTLFFGLFTLFESWKSNKIFRFSLLIIITSIIWFAASMLIIIPYFRGSNHFALNYYADFGDSPMRIILGILDKPWSIGKYIFNLDTLRYFFLLLGPTAFLSLLSPLHLFIALPEFGINLLSNNWNMRNIVFHYTSVIQPFVFIAAIYGTKKFSQRRLIIVGIIILIFSLLFSYFIGPLPYSRAREVHPFLYPQKERTDTAFWQNLLKNKKLKVSATGQLAPFFSSRRFFYVFSKNYNLADYVVLSLNEIYNYPDKDTLIPVYEKLQKDKRYRFIYKNENMEVYKKL
ncbi:DUF2079 domain-containing protein [Candidatus Roizmanbacteria bacterium]|nr:DUF2079 domain-containing protein [Candidatus Roizmanbacteria bacterium]